MIKVLQVNKLYAPSIGGIETVARETAEGLAGLADTRVLVCQPKGEASEEIYNGVPLFRAKSFGIFRSMPISVDFFRKFRKLSGDADVVLLHEPFPLADLAMFFFPPKRKVVVWWHSDIVRQRLLGALLSPFIRRCLRRADSIVAATEGHVRSSRYLPDFAGKCRIIPYGLDFTQYPQPKPGYLDEKLTRGNMIKLLFVGRLVRYKGVGVLIRAMGKISGCELFIVGDGPLGGALREEAADGGLGRSVHFLGTLPRSELLAAYASCDIFVLPSVAENEAFGLVQLEAMYYGKPVINTDLPTGTPFVSAHGKTGLTVRPGDADGLAEAVMRLAGDGGLREIYGENARRRVRERFDLRETLEALYKLYMEYQ